MNRTRKSIAFVVAFCISLLQVWVVYAQTPEDTGLTRSVFLPIVIAPGESAEVHEVHNGDEILGQYIVVLKDDSVTSASVSEVAAEMATTYGGELVYTYDSALNGFTIKFPVTEGVSASSVDALTLDERVAYVEADRVIMLSAEEEIDTTQSGATWGLDRIDQRDRPLNSTFIYNGTGAGVDVYVIDTGIRTTHAQFGGRAVAGYSAINDGRGSNDCNGHGTHVAGTVGGQIYGVAKGARLIAVRVLDCSGSGSYSGVVAGVNWVTTQRNSTRRPSVANMSLGGPVSSSLDTAINNSINSGVVYAIAAGNSNANACNYSPARVANALTVGATSSTDARASYSNYGTCLDLFAPGSSITSAWYNSNTATNTISGTSMATPHVAGVVALYLQGNPSASVSTVVTAIRNNASTNKVTSPGTGSANRLLYTNY